MPAVILSVLALSILLQVAAAVLALRLIRRTTAAGHAWLLLAFAMLLMASRRVVTILGLYFPALEQTFRGVIAETIGLAVAGLVFAGVLQMPRVFDALAAARNASEAGRRRAAFLVEASAALVAAPQEAAVRVALLAKLPVPAFADAVLVDVFDDRGVVRRIAAAAAPGVAEFLCRHHPPNVDAPGELGAVLRGGEPVLAEEAPADALTRIAPGAVSPELSIRSYVIVPLAARDRRFGALIFVSLRERHYSHEDQALAADLARVAALTLDNARLYSEAQEAIHVRDRFLSIASHELRTPLTPLMLQLQSILRRGAGNFAGDALQQKLECIERQVHRLTRLTVELLDVTRITTKRIELRWEEVDLARVVRDVVHSFHRSLSDAGCTVTMQVPASLLGRWDRMRVEQVLDNLLSNAIKYGAGKPIDIVLGIDAERAMLSVRDHGIGIAPLDQSRIFDRFERAVSDHHYGGLGLGLWIVRQILDALHGSIRVESSPGRGSTFIVELPRRVQE